jgi:hypothetical protein
MGTYPLTEAPAFSSARRSALELDEVRAPDVWLVA